VLASAGTEQVRQQTAKQRNAINLFIGLPENVCYLDFTPKLCRSHGPLMTEVIAICLPLACRQPHEERLNGLNILEPWHLQALPFWALVFNLREVAQDFETVGSGFTAAYVSIRFLARRESRKGIPLLLSFSSSRAVQSHPSQAHGSVPFSTRHLRRS